MLQYPFDSVPEPGQVQEIVPGVLWLRMPLPLGLDHINLYLLEDHDGWWIIDTGIAIGPTHKLWEQIFDRHLGGKPVKAVVATHFHPDHTGMAGWLCEKWRVPFYMTRLEYLSGLSFSRMQREHYSWTSEQFLRRSGYSPQQLDTTRERFGGFGPYIEPMPMAYRRLVDGDALTINGNRWRVVVGGGHSPEHACLYCGALNILISGDQVIPKITPNVSVNGGEPEANPLKAWFNSHEHFLEALPADALVLPAHNAPFYGLHERLRFLIEHHEDHLLALEEACVTGSHTAMELLPVLFKRELDESQIELATGECISHLNYLHQRGQLERIVDEQGRYRYQSVDDTLSMRLRKHHHEAEIQPPLQV
ncbi:MAG: MBL fold metallo-hydrolase [Gammaproteobacteria bacterium]|nr:MAG: MBL fold metallo-hydrolase [Gammaproteobacteria bacterium]RLA62224.1 MAG: MBL fold metallo-hydrolase [Gammaproteobacteria bacterium]